MPDLAAAELSIPAEQHPDPAKPLVIPVDSTVVGSTLRFIPWSVVGNPAFLNLPPPPPGMQPSWVQIPQWVAISALLPFSEPEPAVALLHQTGQGKNTVAQIHAGGATPPPQIVLSGGDRDTGDGAQLGVSSAHAKALVAPPPFDGRPQGGGHLEPPARDSSGGCPGFIYPLGPGTYFRTDHFAQQPSAAAF
ncbi:hypothetical protein EMIHUDRAFT_205830 [Emiliania huxleyi CCMP1516]|uniref:Uncharacterized protein n=2 Tax=Emiliania huxleyi TaxID=2903 RepID=A0A0D3JQF0_EMIH1|nr:hypothetical protein EMIHUDRAFT_205830 [Emiliania huxleyi CCMP1516]EOD25735.1 hypothetical protein EMIHUDRAFT_205830 [Emiliania huxleyi CCMP1516]|eukprot:XP_005778164.1 hypothetical protein EMIHUDRAFT_205830 [Emiliania huxleyi CCMP1516]